MGRAVCRNIDVTPVLISSAGRSSRAAGLVVLDLVDDTSGMGRCRRCERSLVRAAVPATDASGAGSFHGHCTRPAWSRRRCGRLRDACNGLPAGRRPGVRRPFLRSCPSRPKPAARGARNRRHPDQRRTSDHVQTCSARLDSGRFDRRRRHRMHHPGRDHRPGLGQPDLPRPRATACRASRPMSTDPLMSASPSAS